MIFTALIQSMVKVAFSLFLSFGGGGGCVCKKLFFVPYLSSQNVVRSSKMYLFYNLFYVAST